nr:hypothetical protein [Maliibacterium massiliense]
MKKAIPLMLVLLLLTAALCGCGPQAKAQDAEATLYTHGLAMVGRMAQMANSEAYTRAISDAPALTNTVAAFGQGDYTAPRGVYRITLPEDALQTLFAAGGSDSFSALPDDLRAELEKRVNTSLVTMLNAQAGAQALAATSLVTATDAFLCPGVTAHQLYLYLFDEGTPAMVSFLACGEDIVTATGYFLQCEDIDLDDEDALADWVGQRLGCSVEAVQIPAR